jgi:hypothetical protein
MTFLIDFSVKGGLYGKKVVSYYHTCASRFAVGRRLHNKPQYAIIYGIIHTHTDAIAANDDNASRVIGCESHYLRKYAGEGKPHRSAKRAGKLHRVCANERGF